MEMMLGAGAVGPGGGRPFVSVLPRAVLEKQGKAFYVLSA